MNGDFEAVNNHEFDGWYTFSLYNPRTVGSDSSQFAQVTEMITVAS
jgi:hypothetical protein